MSTDRHTPRVPPEPGPARAYARPMTDDQDPVGPVRLALTGVSDDRRHLLLVDDEGVPFLLELTPELRAATREDSRHTRRTGPLETTMSSSIRPREIQTRIRAGETAETVAAAAGTTVEAIMPYVAPVLAEREHIATRAQKASVRRAPGEGAAPQGRLLGDAVASHLDGLGLRADDVTWDAYRRDTGRWVLTGAYATAGRTGTARFTYDAPGNYVLSDNDDARWLIGDVLPEPVQPAARDDLQQARERRLSVVADELPLGGTGELPLGGAADEFTVTVGTIGDGETHGAEQPEVAETGADDQLPLPVEEPAAAVADEALRPTADDTADSDQARHRRPAQRKRGRASVPSWDEIMFGSSDQG